MIEYPAIYPFLTGRENLALYAQDTPKMNKLINRLEMTPYIDRKAKGYSVGMKQKLGIAMALLDDPELVILDEPMNGLDIEATILVRKIINDYAKNGTAFLISSHVLSELQKIMTKVLILNQGQIILNTSMNKIMQLQARRYLMQTSDQEAASRVLLENNIEVKQSDNNYLILTKKDLKKAQHELASNHIWLTALIPDGASFEKIVVDILKKKRAEIK
ncbi:ATP-binding cassette domain-containing protein [Limosilactobacillus allomucosae]|uniref:ATP-binding cassette domain-containing protein n=1 Tax=Limosilactobacillus allomucosae TaxID=3142938 RepID=UPI0035E3CDBA